MKKTLKGFLSVVLALSMIFSVSSVAFAANESVAVVESVSENYDGQKTEVTADAVGDTVEADAEETAEDGGNVFTNPFASLITFFRDIAAFIRTLIAFIDAGMPGLPFGKK